MFETVGRLWSLLQLFICATVEGKAAIDNKHMNEWPWPCADVNCRLMMADLWSLRTIHFSGKLYTRALQGSVVFCILHILNQKYFDNCVNNTLIKNRLAFHLVLCLNRNDLTIKLTELSTNRQTLHTDHGIINARWYQEGRAEAWLFHV